MDKTSSTTTKMEDHPVDGTDDHKIFIKTEVEDTEVNCIHDIKSIVSEALETSMKQTANLLKDIKVEPGIKQEDQNDFMFENQCKLEQDEDTFDESSNTDERSIHLEEFDERALKEETTSNDYLGSETISATTQLQESDNKKTHYKKCDKCDYKTKYTTRLREHQRKHTDERPFKCDKCSHRAKTEYCLKIHQYVHTEDRPFKCDQCNYSAKAQFRLNEHQLIHTKHDRPFKCDKCNYSAKNKTKLKRHQLSHTEVKMFKCDKCDHTTNYKSNLEIHKQIHLDPGQLETYYCDMCEYKSINRQNLRKHQLTHKSKSNVKTFTCTTCNFVTKYRKTLKDHLLIHLEPTLQCDHCDYKARTWKFFKQHQLIHKDITGLKTFKCYLCDYITKYKRHLKNHMVNLHTPKKKNENDSIIIKNENTHSE